MRTAVDGIVCPGNGMGMRLGLIPGGAPAFVDGPPARTAASALQTAADRVLWPAPNW